MDDQNMTFCCTRCLGSEVIGSADIVHNKTSEVLLLLPFYQVSKSSISS